MTKRRDTKIEKFLPSGVKRTPLSGDASFRRYERITVGSKTLILMDAPPSKEDCRPFVAIAKALKSNGFSAPDIKAIDFKIGFLLLEDLGDDTFNRVLSGDPEAEDILYAAAVDALAALQKAPPGPLLPIPGEYPYPLPPYSQEKLFEEINLFPDWYLPGVGIDAKSFQNLEAVWRSLFEPLVRENRVLTLRDYHADNLMWLPERKGVKQVGLLDFQDALLGHPAYDLVSLLQDARRPYNPNLEKRMIKRFLDKAAIGDEQNFLTAYQVLGAQRNIKIIGIFTRLWKRDGKKLYPKMIPHMWSLLEVNLKHRALKEIKAWMDAYVPGDIRKRSLT